jgi:hypothetical protein
MKVFWRNPDPINRTSFSIVKTFAVEHPVELRVFLSQFRRSGVLGTILELLINRDKVSHTA